MKEVSEEFLGTNYNLLTNNCNHFTAALCERLTGKSAPAWINRAASIGVALPCMVPSEWINPPDHETAEGELVDEQEDDEDEQAAMLVSDRRRREREQRRRQDSDDTRRSRADSGVFEEIGVGSSLAGGRRLIREDRTPPPRLVSVKDTSGREMPVAERAPLPKRVT